MLWYVEYGSGYCTVVAATSRENARAKAGGSRVPNDWQRIVRPATRDDLDWFSGSGGEIR